MVLVEIEFRFGPITKSMIGIIIYILVMFAVAALFATTSPIGTVSAALSSGTVSSLLAGFSLIDRTLVNALLSWAIILTTSALSGALVVYVNDSMDGEDHPLVEFIVKLSLGSCYGLTIGILLYYFALDIFVQNRNPEVFLQKRGISSTIALWAYNFMALVATTLRHCGYVLISTLFSANMVPHITHAITVCGVTCILLALLVTFFSAVDFKEGCVGMCASMTAGSITYYYFHLVSQRDEKQFMKMIKMMWGWTGNKVE